MTRRVVIAIDGPAAAGKSSTAQWVASLLGFRHVDSGALYRAATAAALRVVKPGDPLTEETVLRAVQSVSLAAAEPSFIPHLNGAPAEEEIRGADVTQSVSRVAQMPDVRHWVNARVQEVARDHDVVVDGRDMGTAVFPDADVKIYLVADPWERAKRRLTQQLRRLPTDDEIAEETDRIVHRDALDATQSLQARDAILVDTTYLTQQEQVDRIAAVARAVTQRGPQG